MVMIHRCQLTRCLRLYIIQTLRDRILGELLKPAIDLTLRFLNYRVVQARKKLGFVFHNKR